MQPEEIFSDSAQTAAFVTEVKASIEKGVFPQVCIGGHIYNYKNDGNAEWIMFESLFWYNCDWLIYFSDSVFDDNGFNSVGIRCDRNAIFNEPDMRAMLGGYDSGGTNASDMDYLNSNNIQSYIYKYAFRFPNPDNPDEYLGLGLIKFWYKYKVVADNDEGWTWYYVVGADCPVGTTIYNGVWGWLDNEHIETLSWTSGATYESQIYTKYVPANE